MFTIFSRINTSIFNAIVLIFAFSLAFAQDKRDTIIIDLGWYHQFHNNPKLKGPRMPVIIPRENENQWLDNNINIEEASELLMPFTSDQLEA